MKIHQSKCSEVREVGIGKDGIKLGEYFVVVADGAVPVARHHPQRSHDPLSGSQDHHPSKNSVQKTICCNSTSNAPDDGRIYPKHVELRIYQQNYLVASSCHSTLFYEEDARSNNP
jgi:hypothetical protein